MQGSRGAEGNAIRKEAGSRDREEGSALALRNNGNPWTVFGLKVRMRGHELHSVLEFCVFLNETEFFKGVLSKESRSEGGRSRGRHVTLAGEPLSLGRGQCCPGS